MNRPLLTALALAWALSACATLPGNQQALDDFRSRQALAAERAQTDGDLFAALTLWQTVTAANPADTEALARIHALKSAIEDETRSALRNGQAAYARGKRREGDRFMLQALALSPGDPAALDALRLSISTASHHRQDRKIASAYAGLEAAKVQPAPVPDNPRQDLERLFVAGNYEAVLRMAAEAGDPTSESADLVHRAHIALAAQARDAQQPELQLAHLNGALAFVVPGGSSEDLKDQRRQLAHALSDDYYRQSLALLKSDLEAAIAALQKSVAFNPDNLSAKDKLDQAKTLRRNLQKIQQR